MVLKYDAIGCSRIPIHNVRLSPNKSDSALGIFNGRFRFTFFLSTQEQKGHFFHDWSWTIRKKGGLGFLGLPILLSPNQR
jgi:hypothetical protein